MLENQSIAIVGAGAISIEYAKVLKEMGKPFQVFGRGEVSAKNFQNEIGVPAGTGELTDQLSRTREVPTHAIVAVNVDQLHSVTQALIDKGVERILLEKPGGVDLREIQDLANNERAIDIYIAYNRRFLPSTLTALDLVQADGGATSFLFEFNENIPLIRTLDQHPDQVKKNWFLANSTHVVDMAFCVAGFPDAIPSETELGGFASSSDTQLPPGQTFVGGGNIGGTQFAYHADWRSAGRWGLEVCTAQRRLVMKPLEQLHEMKTGSFALNPVEINHVEPSGLKPGFYNMVRAFMGGKSDLFVNAKDQANRANFFAGMVGLE